jgi:hypothetical protein
MNGVSLFWPFFGVGESLVAVAILVGVLAGGGAGETIVSTSTTSIITSQRMSLLVLQQSPHDNCVSGGRDDWSQF